MTVECEPGQVEAVAERAGAFGTVEIIARKGVQVVVPITNLRDLAKIQGVRLVRLPWEASQE